MLKIKDNVDLKKLEKFGLEEIKVWGDAGWGYDFTPYTKVNKSYLVILSASREVIFDYIDLFSNAKEVFNLIFDLIQAGLVEKV